MREDPRDLIKEKKEIRESRPTTFTYTSFVSSLFTFLSIYSSSFISFHVTLVRAANQSKTVQRTADTSQFFSSRRNASFSFQTASRIFFFFNYSWIRSTVLRFFFPSFFLFYSSFEKRKLCFPFLPTTNEVHFWSLRDHEAKIHKNLPTLDFLRTITFENESSNLTRSKHNVVILDEPLGVRSKWPCLNNPVDKPAGTDIASMSIRRLFDNGWLASTWCWLQLG